MDALVRGTLAALAYADIHNLPLTGEEVWRWWYAFPTAKPAIAAPTREDSANARQQLAAVGRIIQTGGFWHLPKREALVALRVDRRATNERKWKRARRAAQLIGRLPFVRLVAVCNTVAISNARPDSDIDVFIVVRHGRLWLTRLLVTAVLAARGWWRHGRKIADRICLSYFITDTALDFIPRRLPDDPHLAYWLDQMAPLLDANGTWSALQRANGWVKKYLPNAFTAPHPPPATLHPPRPVAERLLTGRWGDALEHLARSLQTGKMRVVPNAAATGASIVSDDVLKFHEQDRRLEYRERFYQRLRELGIEQS